MMNQGHAAVAQIGGGRGIAEGPVAAVIGGEFDAEHLRVGSGDETAAGARNSRRNGCAEDLVAECDETLYRAVRWKGTACLMLDLVAGIS